MKESWKSVRLGGALIVLLTMAVYIPAMRAGFVWDDDAYVTKNPLLTEPDGLRRIWFSAHGQSQYFPLVYTTLRFEHGLWDFNPLGYHLVNVLLHSMNALLIWAVLRRLNLPGAWLAAAIWAVHPVNVESVAWITELKNTQSTLFYLAALLAWMKFTNRETMRQWRFYALALLLYALALFSKTTACTLPAALLLVLWMRKEPIGWRRFVQVTPFLVFGIAMGLLSVWWEAHLGNYKDQGVDLSFSGLERLLIATHALWFYAAKLAWPTKLTFSYARWAINLRDPLQYTWLIGCIAVALLLWWRRKALGRAPVTAVVFFVAALSPLLGFVALYTFRYSFVADHYQYLASVGLIALFAGAITSRSVTWQLSRNTRGALSFLVLLVLGVLTWQQVGVYRNAETLWRDTLAKNPSSWIANNNLGVVLEASGRVQEAIEHYEQALRSEPDYVETHNNLGVALVQLGRTQEAIRHYEDALRLKPDDAEAHHNLGSALLRLGKVPEAIGHYEDALRLKPDDAEAHYNLGNVLLELGRVSEAVGHYVQALRIKPDYAEVHVNLGNALIKLGKVPEAIAEYRATLRSRPGFAEAHNNLGVALFRLGRVQEAIEHYEQALRIKPNFAEAHNDLGLALTGQGRLVEAIAAFAEALRINPDYANAHNNLGVALAGQGQVVEAIAEYREVLRLRPDLPPALSKLAWIFAVDRNASLRNGPEAVQLAEQLCTVTKYQQADALDVLAAAYAEAGRFSDAIRIAQKAVELAGAAGQQELANQIQERLKLYQAGWPFHEDATQTALPAN